MLRMPELDTVLQSKVEGQNQLPQPDGHISFDAAQNIAVLLGCEHTVPTHGQHTDHSETKDTKRCFSKVIPLTQGSPENRALATVFCSVKISTYNGDRWLCGENQKGKANIKVLSLSSLKCWTFFFYLFGWYHFI